MEIHNISPVFDGESKILILGSFPSVMSREIEFFYGHPKNRFWKVLSLVFNWGNLSSIEDKKSFLLKNNIAVWDVVKCCEITGSSDSSIKNVVINDLSVILKNSKVKQIFVNGKTAEKFYIKYAEKAVGKKAICLPSTSPANASFSLEKLVLNWEIIKDYL